MRVAKLLKKLAILIGEFRYTGVEVVLVTASNAPKLDIVVKKARPK